MGVFDKIKTIFTEEVEDEAPIKKEVIKVEIPSPVSELEKADSNNKENLKKEEKFNFPVFFDDSDFEAIESENERRNTALKTQYSKPKKQEEEERKFKPSPIISPVYGILDKNYRKEDITPKKPVAENTKKEDVTIDDVRKKAFGTLEDLLENTLFGKIIFDDNEKEVKNEKEEKDLFYELEQLENRIANKQKLSNQKNDYADKDETIAQSNSEPVKSRVERNKHLDQQLQYDFDNDTDNNNDLFDLIDSMYKKGDE